MLTLFTDLRTCVLCVSTRLRRALPLAPIPIATPNFKSPVDVLEDVARAGVPLDLYQCEDCGHVQVGVVGNAEFQYRDYVYETSMSLGLDDHFRRYACEVVAALALGEQRLVVEIGSNDGTLLSVFAAAGMRVCGVDPARRIARAATARGIPTIGEYFDETVAAAIFDASDAAALIVANNVIANVAELDRFIRGVELLLADDGVFVFETQYGGDVIERMLLDTVYHEHVSYFLTRPTQRWLASYGLELMDVVRVETKGGSFRLFAQKAGGPRGVSPVVAQWIEREERTGMYAQPFFDRFAARLQDITENVHALVDGEHAAGRSVGGFGVSVGTTTLLAQFNLNAKIDFLVDDDPGKAPYLAGPTYRIPVIAKDRLDEWDARFIVVFAWRYIDSIKKRQSAFLNGGGGLVVPLPQVSIVRAGGDVTVTAAARC